MTASIFTRTGTTTPAGTNRAAAPTLGAFRVVVGFLFALHGLQGLFGAFGGVDGAGAAVPVLSFAGLGSLIPLVCGVLVLLGLFTRPAAVLASGAMAFGYFVVHQPMGALPIANLGEPAALYSWIFLLIAVLGPGSYALDSLRRRSA
jgi:putative oxidoreductase